ncbi:hypothetical protein D3C71_1415600 [compost metagenome]
MYNTATPACEGLLRRISRSVSAASRFMMPVRGSVRAWFFRVSSACLGSVMSWKVPAMRVDARSPGSTSPIMRIQKLWPLARWPCSSSSKPPRCSASCSIASRSSCREVELRHASSCSRSSGGCSWPRMRCASPVRYRHCWPRSHSQPPICASDWARSNNAWSRLSSVMSLNNENTWSGRSQSDENTGTVVIEIQIIRPCGRWYRPTMVLGMMRPLRNALATGHWSSPRRRPCSSTVIHSSPVSGNRPGAMPLMLKMRCAAGLAETMPRLRSNSITPLSMDSSSRR